jgi:gas vesicle protein
MPGDWSNIMKFTTNNSVYYKNIKTVSSIVNKIQSKNKITTSVSENVKGVKTEIKKEEIKSESKPKQEVVSNTNKNTNTKRCFLWWCW